MRSHLKVSPNIGWPVDGVMAGAFARHRTQYFLSKYGGLNDQTSHHIAHSTRNINGMLPLYWLATHIVQRQAP